MIIQCDAALQKGSDDSGVQRLGLVLKARLHGVQGGTDQLKKAQACYEKAVSSVPVGSEAEAYVRYHYALWSGVANEKLGGGRQKQIELLGRAIICVGADSEYGVGYAAELEKVKAKLQTESKSGGCFIATAACGDLWAPEVVVLTSFRDGFLCRSRIGRTFIRLYYVLSPPIATVIARSSVLRRGAMAFVVRPAVYLVRATFAGIDLGRQ